MDEAIYRQHKHDLIRYATVLVGPSDAEDVLSSVIAKLYRSRRTLADLDEPRPYLMKAVFRESLDRNKKRQKRDLPLVDQAIEPVKSRPDVLEAVKRPPGAAASGRLPDVLGRYDERRGGPAHGMSAINGSPISPSCTQEAWSGVG